MLRSRRLLSGAAAAVSVAALVVGGVLAPGAGASKRKTHRFTEHCTGKLTGTSSSTGTCKSRFGRSHYKVVITPPTETQADTYRNGKIYSKGTVEILNGKAGGHFKITKGTGHFKGATGKGTYTVTNTNGNVVTDITGTITF